MRTDFTIAGCMPGYIVRFLILWTFIFRTDALSAQDLTRYTYGERFFILDSLRQYPNHAAVINAQMAQHKYQDRNDILLELELTKLSLQAHSPQEVKQTAGALKALIREAGQDGLEKQACQGIFQLAVLYWYDGNKESAFPYFMDAWNRSLSFSEDEYPPKLAILFEVGKVYSFYEDHANAVRFFRQALQLKDYRLNGLHTTIMNSLATSYRSLLKYDSAMYWYNKSMEIAARNGNEQWMGILQGNIGIVLYLEGGDSAAAPLLRKDIRASLRHNDPGNAANSMIILADILQRQGGTAEATRTAIEARGLMNKVSPADYRLAARIYHTLSTINRAAGDYRAAVLYADSATVAADSVQKIHSGKILAGAQLALQQKIHEQAIRNFHAEQKIYRYARNGFILFIILLSVIALLIIGRMKMRHRYREESLKQQHLISEAARLAAEQEQTFLKKELDEFTRHIHQKNEIVERVEHELLQMRQQIADDSNSQVQHQLIAELRRATILTDEQWGNFTLLFDKVYGDFLLRLRNKLPGCTPADIRFIALSKLNLNNKEMAGMLGIGTDAVRVSKYRLRKKLGLSEEDSLDDLIATI